MTSVAAALQSAAREIGLETGSVSQDYIQLYQGDEKLLTASLEYIQKTAILILDAIGAEETFAPPSERLTIIRGGSSQ